MDERDLALRNLVYRRFVELGRAPTRAELGDDSGLRRLHDAHALVLDERSGEIRMANPFSAIPTPFRVEAGGRSWHGNCAWDAFGIPAALHVDGHVATTCPDCGAAIDVDVGAGRPAPLELVFHVVVPARRWWDDIVFT
jgi:hypothetical protein